MGKQSLRHKGICSAQWSVTRCLELGTTQAPAIVMSSLVCHKLRFQTREFCDTSHRLYVRGLFYFSIERKLTKHKVINFVLFFIQNMFIGTVSHSSWYRLLLVLLPSAGAAFYKPCFSSCRLAEDSRAANTQNYRLCMAKDSDDCITS